MSTEFLKPGQLVTLHRVPGGEVMQEPVTRILLWLPGKFPQLVNIISLTVISVNTSTCFLHEGRSFFFEKTINLNTAHRCTEMKFPPATADFPQMARQVKIGVYLELGCRGHSIPSGGKLSSKLEANKAAQHELINQQRQINSDKHRGQFCPFHSFTGVENSVSDL